MNLTQKVAISLAVVVAVALATTAVLVERWAGDAYRGYIVSARQGQMQQLAAQIALVYDQTRDWRTVQDWLNNASTETGSSNTPQGRGRMHGSSGAGPWRDAAYILVDPVDGSPLAGNAPDATGALATGAPVMLDGAEVARLVLVGDTNGLGPNEQALLSQVRRSIALSAIVSALFALALGAVLMTNILQPLKKIEAGVAAVARGDLSARVVDDSRRDELGRLAANFNSMASSLQEQEQLRRRLVSDLAHELRTPLSVIQGNLQALLDGVYPLSMDELQTVYDETDLLVRLVHDLHELAQAEAGRLPLSLQHIQAHSALQHMANLFRPIAGQRGVSLVVLPAPEGLTTLADPDRLHQILHNLIGNALRHTPAGGSVTLSAKRLTDGIVRISVADSGPGILAQDLPHVFERFYQSGDRHDRQDSYTAGAGLGLAIVKALVEAHRGSVGIQSDPGRGATFWFDLPNGA
ncbi:MAG: ATP-binding protein [Chloroflexota bacterium]|nr:ATP-binding protein [Chloroflexota bacterium]